VNDDGNWRKVKISAETWSYAWPFAGWKLEFGLRCTTGAPATNDPVLRNALTYFAIFYVGLILMRYQKYRAIQMMILI
jgi:hypothetical protein